MSVDWEAVNERRIGEKTQEILLYCAHEKSSMTPRAFDLARISFEALLNNIVDRNPRSSDIVESIRLSMSYQDHYIALCSEKQANSLAHSIVYNYIGDNLSLYPITAEKKLLRSKLLKQPECDIPMDEMTVKDILFIAAAITDGENFSRSTMRDIYGWFKEIGLDPYQTRVYSALFRSKAPLSIKALPQQDLFYSEYRRAAKELISKGFIYELPGELYCVTEAILE